MIKRQAREQIEQQRLMLTTALFANPNWDSEENDREGQLAQLNAHFNDAIELIYNPDKRKHQEEEIDWSNPFWQAAKRAHEKALELHPQLREGATVEDMLSEKDKERLKARKQIDQIAV